MGDEKGPTFNVVSIGAINSLGNGAERRAADRLVHVAEARIEIGDSVVMGRTENVSASGAFLSVPSVLPVGSRIHLSFQLPAGAFEANATVVRIRSVADGGARGAGVGVMFHEVGPESRARLDAFVPPAKAIVRHGPG